MTPVERYGGPSMLLQITDLDVVDSVVTVGVSEYQALCPEDRAFVDDTVRAAGIDDAYNVMSVDYRATDVAAYVMSNGETRCVFKRDQLKPFALTLRIA